MGIDVAALNFILDTRMRTGPFRRTLQIGHQGIHIWQPTRDHATALTIRSGFAYSVEELTGGDSYADTLFRNLGATSVDTIDASNYEGANIVHDLNQPVDPEMYGRFDTIYDGGSLEHIFDVPTVLKNMINMLSVGGHVLIATVANNYLGHGFYQFSPEWAYRVFAANWGCEVLSCYLVNSDGDVVLVPALDPARERKRIEIFTTPSATYLMVAAKKVGEPNFQKAPQQSDYVTEWSR